MKIKQLLFFHALFAERKNIKNERISGGRGREEDRGVV
jgi:hypothetical protein